MGNTVCPERLPDDTEWTVADGPKPIPEFCSISPGVYDENSSYCPSDEWTQVPIGSTGNCAYVDGICTRYGAGGVVGHKGACIRKTSTLGYKGDPKTCCANTSPVSQLGPGKTCDPKYRGFNKPDCQPLMEAYCDNSANFFKPACKAWLQNISKSNKGTVNNLALKYCPGSADPFCACYTAELPPGLGLQGASIYRCFNPQCTSQQALNTLDCPSVYVDCNISDTDVNVNASTIQKIQIANDCGNILIGNPSPTPTPTPNPTPTPTPSPSGGGINKPALIIGITTGLVVIIAIILIIVAVTQKKKGTTRVVRTTIRPK